LGLEYYFVDDNSDDEIDESIDKESSCMFTSR